MSEFVRRFNPFLLDGRVEKARGVGGLRGNREARIQGSLPFKLRFRLRACFVFDEFDQLVTLFGGELQEEDRTELKFSCRGVFRQSQDEEREEACVACNGVDSGLFSKTRVDTMKRHPKKVIPRYIDVMKRSCKVEAILIDLQQGLGLDVSDKRPQKPKDGQEAHPRCRQEEFVS